jgi:hypothetical protein
MSIVAAPRVWHGRDLIRKELAMRSSLFKTVATSLAALTLSAVALATPASAAGNTWHGGGHGWHGGGGGAWHGGGGGWHGGGGGWGGGWGGAGVGLAFGALAGAALAAPYYYGGDQGYCDPYYGCNNGYAPSYGYAPGYGYGYGYGPADLPAGRWATVMRLATAAIPAARISRSNCENACLIV